MVANFKPITMKPCELAERANFYHLSSGMRNDKREMEGAKNSNFLLRERETGGGSLQRNPLASSFIMLT